MYIEYLVLPSSHHYQMNYVAKKKKVEYHFNSIQVGLTEDTLRISYNFQYSFQMNFVQ